MYRICCRRFNVVKELFPLGNFIYTQKTINTFFLWTFGCWRKLDCLMNSCFSSQRLFSCNNPKSNGKNPILTSGFTFNTDRNFVICETVLQNCSHLWRLIFAVTVWLSLWLWCRIVIRCRWVHLFPDVKTICLSLFLLEIVNTDLLPGTYLSN